MPHGSSLDGLLDRVPGWAGRARTVEPLEGGITNRNYRVTLDGESFVVRVPGENTDLLGIDRSHEEEAARRAAALEVGPEVVAFLEPEGSLITRFVVGSAPGAEALRTEPLLGRVAALLRVVYGEPAIGAEPIGEAYFGEVTDRRLAKLRLMKVISDVREAMWGVVQAGVSSLDFDFLDYANKHFERSLENAARSGFDRLLEDAAADA